MKVLILQATLKDDQKAKLREYKEACITEVGADKGNYHFTKLQILLITNNKFICYLLF